MTYEVDIVERINQMLHWRSNSLHQTVIQEGDLGLHLR